MIRRPSPTPAIDERRSWLIFALCLFSTFLCKYIVAIYFPFLILIALWKGRRAALSFCLPLVAASAFYLVRYWLDLKYLLVRNSYSSLDEHGWQLWNVYVGQRAELWVIAALSLLAFAVRGERSMRRRQPV